MEDQSLPAPTLSNEVGENDFASMAALLQTALSIAAGDGRPMAPSSLAVDFTASRFGPSQASASGRIVRATRTLVFVEGEAHDEAGRRLAIASGVFKVLA